jgi:hypothetical protein
MAVGRPLTEGDDLSGGDAVATDLVVDDRAPGMP